MPLLNFWKNAREEVLKLSIEPVISNAGDGVLRDHSECSSEFRQFLRVVPVESLYEYTRHCGQCGDRHILHLSEKTLFGQVDGICKHWPTSQD
jgi:hypothetical protein